MEKLKPYLDTVIYLKPIQVMYQIKNRVVKKKTFKRKKIKINQCSQFKTAIASLDLDEQYLKRFNPQQLLKNEVTLVNEKRELNLNSWSDVLASHLWNFNLHYFEFMIALAAEYKTTKEIIYYEKFKELLLSFMLVNQEIKGDAWQPYTISLRLPNLFICFDLFGAIFENDVKFKTQVYAYSYEQYHYLLKHQEVHLLGNHFFENIKCIILCSLIFDEKIVLKKYLKKLIWQLKEQVLTDGMHFELSMLYHKIILEDSIRIAYWLKENKMEVQKQLLTVIKKMLDCTVSLEKGMGKMPLFNDAGEGIAKETHQLSLATKLLFNDEPFFESEFSESGYYKLYSHPIALMFDAGKIGPNYMPGHGQCDALSFELSLNNEPLFVNSGTYQYQGNLRNYFRSTEAHNTLTINDQQQSICWGEHRVGKRIRIINSNNDDKRVSASYQNAFGDVHLRQIEFCSKDALIVVDSVLTKKTGNIKSYLHLAPENQFEKIEDEILKVKSYKGKILCFIYPLNMDEVTIHNKGCLTQYSLKMGELQKKQALECQAKTECFSGYYIDFDTKNKIDCVKNKLDTWIKSIKKRN